jgi:hypothetical protein
MNVIYDPPTLCSDTEALACTVRFFFAATGFPVRAINENYLPCMESLAAVREAALAQVVKMAESTG